MVGVWLALPICGDALRNNCALASLSRSYRVGSEGQCPANLIRAEQHTAVVSWQLRIPMTL